MFKNSSQRSILCMISGIMALYPDVGRDRLWDPNDHYSNSVCGPPCTLSVIHEGTTLITASAHATTVISIADYIRARFPKVSCDVGARGKEKYVRRNSTRRCATVPLEPMPGTRVSKLRAVRKSGPLRRASVRAICRLELPSRRFIEDRDIIFRPRD